MDKLDRNRNGPIGCAADDRVLNSFGDGRKWQWEELTDEEKASVLTFYEREVKDRKWAKNETGELPW